MYAATTSTQRRVCDMHAHAMAFPHVVYGLAYFIVTMYTYIRPFWECCSIYGNLYFVVFFFIFKQRIQKNLDSCKIGKACKDKNKEQSSCFELMAATPSHVPARTSQSVQRSRILIIFAHDKKDVRCCFFFRVRFVKNPLYI